MIVSKYFPIVGGVASGPHYSIYWTISYYTCPQRREKSLCWIFLVSALSKLQVDRFAKVVKAKHEDKKRDGGRTRTLSWSFRSSENAVPKCGIPGGPHEVERHASSCTMGEVRIQVFKECRCKEGRKECS
jgi:hypothetical protein